MSTNGHTDLLDEEQLTDRLREAAASTRDAYAFMTPGVELFPGDWKLDLTIPECPDRPIREHDVLDAALVYARFDQRNGRATLREGSARWPTFMRKHFTDQKRLRESLPKAMRESFDSFEFGGNSMGYGWGANSEYIPLLPGPVSRQLYWQDYFAMSAKAFEAKNHDPIAWRCVEVLEEFVLGKGTEVTVTYSSGSKQGQRHDKGQQVWDEFSKRNKMDDRDRVMCQDASTLGELFLRYFPAGISSETGLPALTVRSLDPASIYDLITDPEDFETVYAYHQQFQTPYQLYAPSGGLPKGVPPAPTGATKPGEITRFVIRQIPAPEIDHYRLNASGSERRGRSDLFPALTWIQRLRHYLTSTVVRADMLSRIVWDLTVDGNQGDIQTIRQSIFPGDRPPAPGSVLGHSESVSLAPLGATGEVSRGGQVDPTALFLAALTCASIGIPLDYVLQVMRGGTRANALVATEPAAKRFQKRQSWHEGIKHDQFDRVMAAAGITDAQLEVTFPPIASEDTTQLLQNLSYAEANQYLSKKTAATMAAKALDISTYEFETEQGLIADEFPEPEMENDPDGQPNPITGKPAQKPKQGDGVIRRTLISADHRQAAKLDPTKSPSEEDQPPGLLVPTNGAAPAIGPDGQPVAPAPAPSASGRGAMPADENPASAAGAKNIRKDNRESELADRVEALERALREARQPRKRPDDPDFKAVARAYHAETAEHLKALLAAGSTAT